MYMYIWLNSLTTKKEKEKSDSPTKLVPFFSLELTI